MSKWTAQVQPEDLEKFVHEKLWAKKWVADTKSTWTKEVWNNWGNKKAA